MLTKFWGDLLEPACVYLTKIHFEMKRNCKPIDNAVYSLGM